MNTKINYTVVGAFVILLTSAIIFLIIWLSAGFNKQRYQNFIVYMNESVAGLNKGSSVKYNGVNVGFIKELQVNYDNPQQVKIILSVNEKIPVTDDTSAILMSQGLTGVTFIGLKNDGSSTRLLEKQPGQPYPVIKTSPSLMFKLDTAITQLTSNLNQLLNTENKQTFKDIMIHLETLTSDLAANNKALKDIVQNTAKASAQLPLAMQAFTQQTLPAANQLLENMHSVTDNLNDITNTIKQNPSVLIRGAKNNTALGPGEK